MTFVEDVAAIGTTGKDEHTEIVFPQNQPTLVFEVETGITIHPRDFYEFLIVDFQDVAAAARFADDIFGIEILAKIDVEDAQTVSGDAVEELLYGFARCFAAL